MRAVWAELPEQLIEDRRRKGLDGRDEMWEGVLHMVPPAREAHQWVGSGIFAAFWPLAVGRGLRPYYETGLFRTDDDYRVPDQVYARPEHRSARGVEGAVLVIELLSPGDETYAKLDWYAAVGVEEVLVVDPDTRRPEHFVRGDDGQLVLTDGEPVRIRALDVELSVVDGPRLLVVWDGGSAEI